MEIPSNLRDSVLFWGDSDEPAYYLWSFIHYSLPRQKILNRKPHNGIKKMCAIIYWANRATNISWRLMSTRNKNISRHFNASLYNIFCYVCPSAFAPTWRFWNGRFFSWPQTKCNASDNYFLCLKLAVDWNTSKVVNLRFINSKNTCK